MEDERSRTSQSDTWMSSQQTFTNITVKQSYFIKDMLHKYNKYLIKATKSVPMMPEVNLCKDMCAITDEQKEQMSQLPYREVVGKLFWLSLCTRSDIMYAITQCAKFCNDYGPTHWYALMYILSYLSGTIDYGLV